MSKSNGLAAKPEAIQRRFYEETASAYDDAHAPEAEHQIALHHISCFLHGLAISSILDVGCGTGRALRSLVESHPQSRVVGVEPVQALLTQAVERNHINRELLVCGSGANLPFEDNSFDAVCEFAVLHHVREPHILVKEMIRVARKAVFLSDSNRFGQGRFAARVLKLVLYKTGLWYITEHLHTRGKGYRFSEGDGLFYSYSVFDSYDLLAEWADRIILIPGGESDTRSWFHPLLTSGHVLCCAFKERVDEGNS